jgi:hypothetical protein
MELVLERFCYSPTETEGRLRVGNVTYATMERPWIPAALPGGKVRESCIPDGTYAMEKWTSPSFGPVFRLFNHQLGVFKTAQHRGRSAILVHKGNWVQDVVGCIAVGMARGILDGRRAVRDSNAAMKDLLMRVGDSATLIIRPSLGASDEPGVR